MELFSTILDKFFGDAIQSRVDKKLKEVSGMEPNLSKTSDIGYRPITQRQQVKRDIPDLTRERGQNIAAHLYIVNPLASRILKMKKDFIIGEGITFQAEDKEVQEILEKHWYDPVNQWDLKQHTKALEIGLYGEQFYPTFVNPANGHVRLGYLDPTIVEKVITNPGNVEDRIGIKIKSSYADWESNTEFEHDKEAIKKWMGPRVQKGSLSDYMKIISIDLDPTHVETYGLLTGETFYFSINQVSNMTRGISDLLPLADWLDSYDEFLFNRVQRARLLNRIIWDVKLEGFDANQIKEWLKDQRIPRPDSILAHNEKVTWQQISTKLEASDAGEEIKSLLRHILGGAGFPPHYFGGGEGLNRALATEMSTPIFKHLKSRQMYFKYMIQFIFRYTIDQAIIARRLKRDVNKKVIISMPKLSEKDLPSLGTALTSFASALDMGEENEWISKEKSKKVFQQLVSLTGVGVDEEKDIERQPEGMKKVVDIDTKRIKREQEALREADFVNDKKNEK